MATEYKLSYTASEIDQKLMKINGVPTTQDVDNLINAHNTGDSAHNDIRILVNMLTTKLNTLADSNDATLDQMSEVVSYIKSNKSLIEDITSNKVNVSDIINNLTTNATNKPLSAAQGVALKSLIDALQTVVDGKANSSHGNHVPTTQTANNATFLRNDNTWQKVTPANIGAAASSHNQVASTITAGTFAGQVVANSSGQAAGTSLLRNSKLVSAETNPTVNGEIYWTYE